MQKVKWKYNGEIYNTRREITEKFGWSTHKWNAKLREGKIKKLFTKTEDKSNERIHSDAKLHS